MIRPSYWTDADLHTRLNADQREFYIGLWMQADDAGYVCWDLDRVGAELYPYRTAAWRRDRLPKWLALMPAHVRILSCGKHVVVVNLTKYQKPPRPSKQNLREHEETCPHVAPRTAMWGQVGPAQEGKRVRRGEEEVGREEGRFGAGGLTTDDEETSEFRERMAAIGVSR